MSRPTSSSSYLPFSYITIPSYAHHFDHPTYHHLPRSLRGRSEPPPSLVSARAARSFSAHPNGRSPRNSPLITHRTSGPAALPISLQPTPHHCLRCSSFPSYLTLSERSSPSRVRYAAPDYGGPLTAPGRSPTHSLFLDEGKARSEMRANTDRHTPAPPARPPRRMAQNKTRKYFDLSWLFACQ